MKLLKCPICGNVVEVVEDHGVPVMCCGKPMVEIKAGEVMRQWKNTYQLLNLKVIILL